MAHTPEPWRIQQRKDGLGALANHDSLEIVSNEGEAERYGIHEEGE